MKAAIPAGRATIQYTAAAIATDAGKYARKENFESVPAANATPKTAVHFHDGFSASAARQKRRAEGRRQRHVRGGQPWRAPAPAA